MNCPLCEIDLNENNIIRLTCNPDKHYFCNECIIDWFSTINKNKNHLIVFLFIPSKYRLIQLMFQLFLIN